MRPGPSNLTLAIGKRLTMRGFLTSDYLDRTKQAHTEVAGWLRDGSLTLDQTIVDGLENAPQAFIASGTAGGGMSGGGAPDGLVEDRGDLTSPRRTLQVTASAFVVREAPGKPSTP
ncbi:hypothetical protein FRAHR75_400036 [Frankia sp. Hr75.2]|nr:hypothetical protein FRAHR75_400036 [Frankia sp. Hr75.2]